MAKGPEEPLSFRLALLLLPGQPARHTAQSSLWLGWHGADWAMGRHAGKSVLGPSCQLTPDIGQATPTMRTSQPAERTVTKKKFCGFQSLCFWCFGSGRCEPIGDGVPQVKPCEGREGPMWVTVRPLTLAHNRLRSVPDDLVGRSP